MKHHMLCIIISCMNTPIKAYSIEGIFQLVKELGLPKFRGSQILSWLYAKHAGSYEEMSNLPAVLRNQLSEEHPLYTPQIIDKQTSIDGTRKYVLEFNDHVIAETVGIPSEDGRLTVCVSSQAGCAMKCAFCATGKQGLTRNLLPGEIVDQILTVEEDFGCRVSNIVVMGQGEPFANYDNTLTALRICNNEKLLNIGARKITVSSCGILTGIEKFSHEPEQFTLAISLHAARQNVRDKIMPGVAGMPLSKLRAAIESYLRQTDRRITFEYALMRGVNNSKEDLASLIDFCSGLLCHVNLICLNEIEDSPFKPVSEKEMLSWCESLNNAGINATIRRSKGEDIAGACGQLANSFLK